MPTAMLQKSCEEHSVWPHVKAVQPNASQGSGAGSTLSVPQAVAAARGAGPTNAAGPVPPARQPSGGVPHDILFWIWRCRKQRYSTYDMPPAGVRSSTSAE